MDHIEISGHEYAFLYLPLSIILETNNMQQYMRLYEIYYRSYSSAYIRIFDLNINSFSILYPDTVTMLVYHI